MARCHRPPTAMKTLTRLFLTLLVLGGSARGQLPVSAVTNLFGDDLVTKSFALRAPLPPPPEVIPGLEQTLYYADGGQLRGELVSVDRNEIRWSRPDFSAPCSFLPGEVTKLLLGKEEAWINGYPRFEKENNGGLRATVQLAGGDWLCGNLVSIDGRSFTMTVGELVFQMTRDEIEWIRIAPQARPAFSNLHGIDRTVVRPIGGSLLVPENQFVGWMIPQKGSFAVSFELAEGFDEGATLLFQDGSPTPDLGYRGTAFITLGSKELMHAIKVKPKGQWGIELIKTPVRPEASGSGPVRYQILYDAKEPRFLVYRNGVLTGDWGRREAAENSGTPDVEIPAINSVCLVPPEGCRTLGFPAHFEPHPLLLHGFRIEPWDGVIPNDPEPKLAGDQLFGSGHLFLFGDLNAISATEMTFSSRAEPLKDGLEINFGHRASPPATFSSRVILGSSGELDASDLQIANGTARFHTRFAGNLEIPASLVTGVVFPENAAPGKGDNLAVFRNGEVLRGKLSAMAMGKPLQWQSRNGRQIEVRSEHVAGVLLRPGEKRDSEPPPNLIEFLNGDRLRGELGGLSEKEATFHQPVLGNLRLDPVRISRLFPSVRWTPVDIDQASAWVGVRPLPPAFADLVLSSFGTPGLYLDGCFVSVSYFRSSRKFYQSAIALSHPAMPDQYELSFEVTSAPAALPNFRLYLTDSPRNEVHVRMELVDGALYWLAQNGASAVQGEDLQLSTKVRELSTRLSFRAFVDAPAGRLSLFCEGVAILELGREAATRMSGAGKGLELSSRASPGSTICSNIRISPWSGTLPTGQDRTPRTELTNGDVAFGKLKEFHEGNVVVETDAGPIETPLTSVRTIVFSEAFAPIPTAARLRLTDGSVSHVDAAQWDGATLSAHSPVFGDIHIPSADLTEMIFDPSPPRIPHPLVGRKK